MNVVDAAYNEKGRIRRRLCMQRLRAERAGKDVSMFPPRERGPKAGKYRVGKRTPLQVLREKHPELEWCAAERGFGTWRYKANNGWTAHWVSCLAPRYDGDDETSVSRFYIYKDSTKELPEELFII